MWRRKSDINKNGVYFQGSSKKPLYVVPSKEPNLSGDEKAFLHPSSTIRDKLHLMAIM
jgi:hypothetical protein